MRKYFLCVMFFCFSLFLSCNDSNDSNDTYRTPTGTGYLSNYSGPLQVLNLNGSYTDMGAQYGYLLKTELNAFYQRLDAVLHFDTNFVHLLDKFKALIENTRISHLLQGMKLTSGLTYDQLVYLNFSIAEVYFACSAYSAWGDQTTDGYTISGRNWDIPSEVYPQVLAGTTSVVIYNPIDQYQDDHKDNSVAVHTPLGWVYGLTIMNSKGLYFEYNNGTTSVPIDPDLMFTMQNGLMQNFYLAFDSDTLEEVDTEMKSSTAAVACIVQVADENRAWHYERSPYEPSRKVQSASASEDCGSFSYCYYKNPSDTDIFTNFFYLNDWMNQDTESFYLTPTPTGDSNSRAVQRLVNMQNLAQTYSNINDVNTVKTIMTTPLVDGEGGGPFLDGTIEGAEDFTFFSSVADIKNRILHVNSQTNDNPSHWTSIHLNQYFLHPEITYLASRRDMVNGRVRKN